MPQLVAICLLVFLLISSACQEDELPIPADDVSPSAAQLELIDVLNQQLHPLPADPSVLSGDVLGALDGLTDSRIIALGEATHGTREFFQMKDQLFRYFASEKGYRAICFEMDFAESLFFENYVTKGIGDLESLMKEKMIFWTWRTEAVRDLLEWMRTYNMDKPFAEQIHFFGFDCQNTRYNADMLVERLNDIDEGLANFALHQLISYKSLSYDRSAQLSDDARQTMRNEIEAVYDTLLASQALIEANSSTQEYQLIQQLARTVLQTEEVFWAYHKGSITNFRDLYMAQNSLWIANYLGTDAKVVLWAHNAHVANDITYGGSGSMGAELRAELDEAYQIIGFSFSKGSFTAVTPGVAVQTQRIDREPLKNSFNFLLHHANQKAYYLILENLQQQHAWRNWLKAAQPLLLIGSTYTGLSTQYYRSVQLPLHYDVIIHFDQSSNSKLL